MPIDPAAPGLFSTMTACPQSSLNFCATIRAIRSELPAGGYVTTTLTGLDGYVCADAALAHSRAASTRKSILLVRIMAPRVSLMRWTQILPEAIGDDEPNNTATSRTPTPSR